MAKRNMKQIIKDSSVPDRYSLTVNEVRALVQEGMWDGICDAFKYGFVLGTRYQKKQGKIGMRRGNMDDTTYLEICNHLEIAEDGLKELAFDEENSAAIASKNEILKAIQVFEQWYDRGYNKYED